jgi:hypothetical protein
MTPQPAKTLRKDHMTKEDKRELRVMCKSGCSFEDMKEYFSCSDATIKRYMKTFSQKKEVNNG